MKVIISIVYLITVIPASIVGMIYGWGLTPENWGWIAFSYAWVVIGSLMRGKNE